MGYVITSIQRRKIKRSDTLPITVASNKTKYLGINLGNAVKNIYYEKFKPLKKITEKSTRKGKNIHAF